jgi:hypothetical protein
VGRGEEASGKSNLRQGYREEEIKKTNEEEDENLMAT